MFTNHRDNDLLRELIDAEVVKKGLDGFEKHEGMDLFGHLLLNAEKIDASLWLDWLTNRRGLLRIARLDPNPEWIGSMPLTTADRASLANEHVFPAFESGGSWVCAALRNDAGIRGEWQKNRSVSLLFIAPTPVELRNVARFYR